MSPTALRIGSRDAYHGMAIRGAPGSLVGRSGWPWFHGPDKVFIPKARDPSDPGGLPRSSPLVASITPLLHENTAHPSGSRGSGPSAVGGVLPCGGMEPLGFRSRGSRSHPHLDRASHRLVGTRPLRRRRETCGRDSARTRDATSEWDGRVCRPGSRLGSERTRRCHPRRADRPPSAREGSAIARNAWVLSRLYLLKGCRHDNRGVRT